MRLVRYSVAMSLDGYIAGPNGESDWIVMDPGIDFSGTAEFDAFLFGRKTFEALRRMGSSMKPARGTQNIVFSRKLQQADFPHGIVSDDAERFVAELRHKPGKDIALFGGGGLFRSLLGAGLIDRVEVGVIPVLLGIGIPLLSPPASRAILKLRKHRVYEKTGTVSIEYDIIRSH